MANLLIITRTPEPKREAQYPRTWLVYRQDGREAKAIVTHCVQNRPQVKRWETRPAA